MYQFTQCRHDTVCFTYDMGITSSSTYGVVEHSVAVMVTNVTTAFCCCHADGTKDFDGTWLPMVSRHFVPCNWIELTDPNVTAGIMRLLKYEQILNHYASYTCLKCTF